jgi:hypothetical protein
MTRSATVTGTTAVSNRLDQIAALDAKQQVVYREAREAGFGIDYAITLARKSGDLPGYEKPGHWFDTNTNGFSEET